jgi:hypothetical protein
MSALMGLKAMQGHYLQPAPKKIGSGKSGARYGCRFQAQSLNFRRRRREWAPRVTPGKDIA